LLSSPILAFHPGMSRQIFVRTFLHPPTALLARSGSCSKCGRTKPPKAASGQSHARFCAECEQQDEQIVLLKAQNEQQRRELLEAHDFIAERQDQALKEFQEQFELLKRQLRRRHVAQLQVSAVSVSSVPRAWLQAIFMQWQHLVPLSVVPEGPTSEPSAETIGRRAEEALSPSPVLDVDCEAIDDANLEGEAPIGSPGVRLVRHDWLEAVVSRILQASQIVELRSLLAIWREASAGRRDLRRVDQTDGTIACLAHDAEDHTSDVENRSDHSGATSASLQSAMLVTASEDEDESEGHIRTLSGSDIELQTSDGGAWTDGMEPPEDAIPAPSGSAASSPDASKAGQLAHAAGEKCRRQLARAAGEKSPSDFGSGVPKRRRSFTPPRADSASPASWGGGVELGFI